MCADAPDMTVANEAARSASALGARQMDMMEQLVPYYKDRQANLDALTNRVTESQLGIQKQTADQGQDYYDYNKETYRPVEQGLVAEVLKDSTPEAYARLASTAAARTGVTFRNMSAAADKSARSMGVDPSSGQARGIRRGAEMAAAAEGSAAFNSAYDTAQKTNYARKLDVVGIGRNLPGASTAAYGVSVGAGSSAAGAANNASQTAGGTIGTAGSWGSAANSSMGTAIQGNAAAANAENAASASSGQVLGALAGAGATAYGLKGF